jgi:hypothetical protein
VLLTRSPLSGSRSRLRARLACVKHAASVHSEPGSNSPVWILLHQGRLTTLAGYFGISQSPDCFLPLPSFQRTDAKRRDPRQGCQPPQPTRFCRSRNPSGEPGQSEPSRKVDSTRSSLPCQPPSGSAPDGAGRRVSTENQLPGSDLLSHTLAHAVPSALRGLTAVFGMGTGVSPSPEPPEKPWTWKRTFLWQLIRARSDRTRR